MKTTPSVAPLPEKKRGWLGEVTAAGTWDKSSAVIVELPASHVTPATPHDSACVLFSLSAARAASSPGSACELGAGGGGSGGGGSGGGSGGGKGGGGGLGHGAPSRVPAVE